MSFAKVLCVGSSLAAILTLSGCSSCTAQHHPEKDRELFMSEEESANKPQPRLDAGGKLPPQPVAGDEAGGAVADIGTQKFNTFCASCHGIDGTASGPAAASLNPKPRNFTDMAWQNKVDDAHIAKVIKEGGASVGLSPLMAPWGAALSDAEIAEVVKHVRSFKKK